MVNQLEIGLYTLIVILTLVYLLAHFFLLKPLTKEEKEKLKYLIQKGYSQRSKSEDTELYLLDKYGIRRIKPVTAWIILSLIGIVAFIWIYRLLIYLIL